MNSRTSTAAAALLLLTAALPAQSAVFSVDVDLNLDSINLTGTGPVPLAPGWVEMNTQLDITESASGTSTLSVSVGLDFMTGMTTVALSSSLYLDLLFTDQDVALDFGGMLHDPMAGPTGSTISLIATQPLVTSINGSFSLEQLQFIEGYLDDPANLGNSIQDAVDAWNALTPDTSDDIVATIDDPKLEYDLGTSLGGDPMLVDAISFSASSFLFDILNTDIDVQPDGTATLTANGLTFTGGVFDLGSDPPFMIGLSGLITGDPALPQAPTLPEPMTLAMLGFGVVAFAGLRRRTRRT